MRYLLDTSALLAHYRKEAGWEAVQALFESSNAEIIIASISLTEFSRRLRDLGATEAEAIEITASYQLLCDYVASVDVETAMAAFSIGCRTPRRLPLADALIAATAQRHAATLVHRDEHMRAIPAESLPQRDLSD